MFNKVFYFVAAVLLGSAPSLATSATDDWRQVATSVDEERIAKLPQAWQRGLQEARKANRRGVARLGSLLRPSGALANPHPGPGNYRCRTIKLGSQGASTSGFVPYGWFNCRVDLSPGGDLSLTKTSGSQRQMGKLYPYRARQLVFIGTLALGAQENAWPRYASNPERNVVGVLERLGANRYRLLMPAPVFESELDVLELVRR